VKLEKVESVRPVKKLVVITKGFMVIQKAEFATSKRLRLNL